MASPNDLYAQNARGAIVPPDSMMDSPQYLVLPDTGDEKDVIPPSSRDLYIQDRQRRANELLRQMHDVNEQLNAADKAGVSNLDPHYRELMNSFFDINNKMNDMNKEFLQSSVGQFGQRALDRSQNVPADADIIMKAIEDRQQQQRGVPMSSTSALQQFAVNQLTASPAAQMILQSLFTGGNGGSQNG